MLHISVTIYIKTLVCIIFNHLILLVKYAAHLLTSQLGVVIDLKEKVARSSVMSPVVVSYKAQET